MTDQYFSRLLAIARQNRNIKFIKNLDSNTVTVEMMDGSEQDMGWHDVLNHQNILTEQRNHDK